ncbi:MAG: LPP20 family lipoprotein [Spirochaetales bacterium]|nr:LPP20 family lipoprotein [Spirochaetales bacterium]
MKIVKIAGIAVLLLLLFSCVTTSGSTGRRPGWMDDKYSAYPESDYLVEIGQGSSLKDARRNAAASMAQIFRTSIKVETSIQTRYKEFSSGGSVQSSEETDYNENIIQLAEQELINVNFGESWTNELGQVHVLAYIDRHETAQIYRGRIMENEQTVNSFLSRAGKQDSLIRKYAYLDAAYVVAQANRNLMEQLEIINLMISRTIMISYDMDEIRNSRRDTSQSMAFRLFIGNDDEGKVSSVIADELTSLGFVVDPAGLLSVTGSLLFEKVELDNSYENLKYYLTIDVVDEQGRPVVSLEENDRVSALSLSDVRNRAYLEIEKAIKKELIGQLTEYFDSFVQ